MLPVNDEVRLGGVLEVAHTGEVGQGREFEPFLGEQENGPRDGRLGEGGFVEVHDGPDLFGCQFALEGFVAAFDPGDETGHLVLLGGRRGSDLVAFVVEARGEPDVAEEIFRREADEVEPGVFLLDLNGDHGVCESGLVGTGPTLQAGGGEEVNGPEGLSGVRPV